MDLIDTDLPLWHGDSGGPLLSGDGRLIGVFTEYFWWFDVSRKWRTTFFFPNREFVQGLIARDRASGKQTRLDLHW